MGRETKEQKAERLKVEVLKAVMTGTIFEVEGDTSTHTVIVNTLRNKITCDCPWFSLHPDTPCSHVLAVEKLIKELKEMEI